MAVGTVLGPTPLGVIPQLHTIAPFALRAHSRCVRGTPSKSFGSRWVQSPSLIAVARLMASLTSSAVHPSALITWSVRYADLQDRLYSRPLLRHIGAQIAGLPSQKEADRYLDNLDGAAR
jgi:hypothetical protein